MDVDDRVLVCVINRQRDWQLVQHAHWYRIPQARAPRQFVVDYLAFFLSGSAKRALPSGIYAYAPMRGYELQRRRDLLPQEQHHPRADDLYYRIALGELIEKRPPILNPSHYTITFILTTGEAFCTAKQVNDLYIPSLDTAPRHATIWGFRHWLMKNVSDADF